jgi:hypothetical protein
VASDQSANAGKGFRVLKDTQLIMLDNTAPAISTPTLNEKTGQLHFSFSAQDQVSPLASAEYSLDGQSPVLFQSRDGIIDELSEDFELVLARPTRGTHTLVVRISDRLGNVRSAHKTFVIQ